MADAFMSHGTDPAAQNAAERSELSAKRSESAANRAEKAARIAEAVASAEGASQSARFAREAEVERTTNETDIRIAVDLDGMGATDVETGVPFFDHMLTAFGRHSLIDLTVRAKGDIEVDAHHTVEDVGIVLGQAVARALGDKRGIARFGSLALPMDEALVLAAVDISGRGQLHWAVDVPCVMLGTFDASLAKEFFIAFAANAGLTLHVRSMAGENAHHIVEASFKAAARALRQAVERDPRIGDALPSTKGSL